MISLDTSDDTLRELFNRKPAPVPDSNDLETLFGGTSRFTEGQAVRLLVEMEELPAGICGAVRLAANHGNETDGVEFEADCISIRRHLNNGELARVIDHVEPVSVDLDDTQEIDVDAVLARSASCVDPQVDLDDTARWLAAQQPVPELSEHMQAVSGFFTSLVWAIEDRTPLDKLSDDQREILARVSAFME